MRIRSVVATVATAVLATTLLGVGTAAAAAPVTGLKVYNWYNGIAIGVENNSTASGAFLRYQNDSDAAGQFWSLQPVTPNTYMLRNLNSNMCASVRLGTNGYALVQVACDARFPELQFSLAERSPGRYRIVSEATNRCIAPTNATTLPVDNNYVRVYDCVLNRDNQTYYFDTR